MKPKHLVLLLVLFVTSCKITRDDMVGTFVYKKTPTIRLRTFKDSTFEFIKITKNPYLHPFEHPDEYFLITAGYWKYNSSKDLILNSEANFRYTYKSPRVTARPPADSKDSHFVFNDLYRNRVNIVYVELEDKSIVMIFHQSMKDFSFDLSKSDTLKFYFYGYPPYTFINDKKPPSNYEITLFPNLNPNYFNKRKFKIHKNKIVDESNKASFKHIKNDSTVYQ